MNQSVKISVNLRPAEPEDLKIDAQNMKTGQCFWLRSEKTGEFDNAPYILREDSDPWQIFYWLKNKMIFVPVSSLEASTAKIL